MVLHELGRGSSLFFLLLFLVSVSPVGSFGTSRQLRATPSRLLQRARHGQLRSIAKRGKIDNSTATTLAALMGNTTTNVSIPLPLNDTALVIGDIAAEVGDIEASLQRMSAAINGTAARVQNVASMGNGTVAELTKMSNETLVGQGEAETNNATIQGQLLLAPDVVKTLNGTHKKYLDMNNTLVKIRQDLNASAKLASADKRVNSAMDVLKLLDPRFKKAIKRMRKLNETTFDGNFTLTLRDEVDEVVQNILEDANIAQSQHIHEDAEKEEAAEKKE